VELVFPFCCLSMKLALGFPSPYYEDQLRWIRFGGESGPKMRQIKPCTRCIFTTVDPNSGTADKTLEPLKTLRSYRTSKDAATLAALGSPFFGVNLAMLEGEEMKVIKVGDGLFEGFS